LLAIARFFVDLCLLRRNPQDLPASASLLAAVLLVGLLGGMLLSLAAGAPVFVGVAQTALDFLLMLGVLHLALKALDKRARYLQTATALVGADTLIGLVALLPVGLAGPSLEESPQLLLAGLLFLGLVVWSVVVTGHILRHAFDIKLAQGVAIAVAFDVLSFVIVGGLVEGAV
jgi:hypothetical protein